MQLSIPRARCYFIRLAVYTSYIQFQISVLEISYKAVAMHFTNAWAFGTYGMGHKRIPKQLLFNYSRHTWP